MGMLGTAVTGINAAQIGLLTTEHNIANANTPGYSRQRILQSQVNPVFTGGGFLGQGTQVTTVERQYDAFIANQVNQSQSSASELGKYHDEIAQIDNILADTNSGLSPAVQDFFRGVQQVASDPSSMPARQALVSSGQALSARFQSIETRLEEIYEGVDTQITSSVSTINSLANQIGRLNDRILVSGSTAQQPANDLLDQRDQLIAELNKQIRVQVVNDPNGAYNVFVGNGQQLVVGSQVSTMAAQMSPSDSTRLIVGLQSSVGFVALPEAAVTGGELGGLLRFRSESLDSVSSGLGQVAASLVLVFNAQHALGQDLIGQVAGNSGFAADFFAPISPNVLANTNNTSGTTVAASYVVGSTGGADFYTDLTTSDYRLVANGGGNFTLTRLTDNKTWGPLAIGSATAPFTNGTLNSILSNPADPAYDPQGFTLTVTGTPAVSESFLIQPTREAARNFAVNSAVAVDPRLIAAAAPVRAQSATTNVGSGKVVVASVVANYVPPPVGSPLTLSFGAAGAGFPNGSLAGFPVGSQVTLSNAGVLNGTYSITALTDRVPYQTGATIAVDNAAAGQPTGLRLQLDGLPTVGDQYVIGRNTQGVADARNMLVLADQQSRNIVSGQTASLQMTYARLVSEVGNRSREAAVIRDAQEKLLEQATAFRNASSGVNLDEEAANLIRFQQAYQASAKSLEIASRLFEQILALGG